MKKTLLVQLNGGGLRDVKRQVEAWALSTHNKTDAAKVLKIRRSTLYYHANLLNGVVPAVEVCAPDVKPGEPIAIDVDRVDVARLPALTPELEDAAATWLANDLRGKRQSAVRCENAFMKAQIKTLMEENKMSPEQVAALDAELKEIRERKMSIGWLEPLIIALALLLPFTSSAAKRVQSPKAAAQVVVPMAGTTVGSLAAPGPTGLAGVLPPAPVAVAPELPGQQARIGLAWTASPDATVVGYRIYYGVTAATNSVDVGNVTNATVRALPEGVALRFYATAYDAGRVESIPSNTVTNYMPYYVSMAPAAYNILGYGAAGKTNVFEWSTNNLTGWTGFKTFLGTGQLTNGIYWTSNATQAFFRIRKVGK